ncbi:conserved hypothetical protein [Histoplasma capsulatum var. duboisii H88]|uniref:Mitochondrial F1F0 ATP synthase subunit Atp14 n=2 Tax=Ajellomyces capsulatus TaxID=5037 RepID=F0U7X7_AJEC8|nr:conserved hypothetical protein [Histoplasma capsulatum H143]EGC40799.1 conserved hypothetical protein [Histoplasma capsulatum var. duboisii H88]
MPSSIRILTRASWASTTNLERPDILFPGKATINKVLSSASSTFAMMSQSLRVSRCLLARMGRQPLTAARRTFIATPIRQAELVQDMYLREVRAYKFPPSQPSDADAHVQKFSAPKPPPSPEEANLATDLKAYETQEVEVEGQATSSEPAVVEEDWFEDEDEAPAAH